MTFLEQLKIEIQSGPLAAECAAANGDLAITEILNRGDFAIAYERMVSARGVMRDLGATQGSAILDKLEAAAGYSPPVKWALHFLKQDGGLDVGAQSTRDAIDGLAQAGALTPAEAAALKGLAERLGGRSEVVFGRAVTVQDVGRALRGPWS